MAIKKKGLGKGLGALIAPKDTPAAVAVSDVETGDSREQLVHLDPHHIEPNPKQPRTYFNEEALEELAASIKQDGVQEPVLVRRVNGRYELISGERRVRASIMAGLTVIPAICREISDRDMLKLGLIENIQREDLNSIETAKAYQLLIDEFGWTQEQLATEVGKKRVTVTNTLRLLNLPPDVQARVEDASISMGHAKALLSLDNPERQRTACRKIIEQGLSVRQAEKLASEPDPQHRPPKPPKDPNVSVIEDDLRQRLGTRVNVKSSKKNRGKIEIEFFNLDELERLLDLLRNVQ